MALIVTRQGSTLDRVHYAGADGVNAWINNYLGRNMAHPGSSRGSPDLQVSDTIAPVAYLVEQAPGTPLRIHFHAVDQFQVLLPSDGMFGRKAIERTTVHFAAAYSPYGPIAAGQETLRYFTLRNGRDPGGRFLPECRSELLQAKQKPRSAHAAISHPTDTPVKQFDAEYLIEQDQTGLFTTCFALPARFLLTTPSPAEGRGQYWLLLSGTCRVEDRDIDALGLWFVHPSEDPVSVEAGEHGARLLGMQFPLAAGANAHHKTDKPSGNH